MPPAGVPAKRQLPSKEVALFKELLNLYETRQLKKGLKAADQILKKVPEHGETLCMKGLVLTHLGQREEGLELVKKGIRLDLTSHICWHVFGLIQKGEKNYEEALKSYTQALRFDKENLNILRDAAHLQAQLRQYSGLLETRHTLLRLRPNLRQNWVSLAVAYHLNGNLVETKKVLEHYEETVKNVPDYDVEHSETLLYHIRVLEELGEFNEALALLDTNAKSRAIIDRVAIMEYRARLLTTLKQVEDAEHTWQALMQQNADSYDYYKGFFANRGIDIEVLNDENRGAVLKSLRELSAQFPKAAAPKRLALNVAKGDDFRDLVKSYLINAFEKGIPSLFADVKSLYKDHDKLLAIQSVVEEQREAHSAAGASEEAKEPSTHLWTLYFLAQHYSYIHQHTHALELLDEAFAHTPTLPELYMLKARVLKRVGDPYGAARCMDEARTLDLQDRFLNTKCGKYRLRAGMEPEAQEVLGLFTKKDAANPGADLEDMQSVQYLIENADCHRRNGNLAMALKRYVGLQKIFNEIEDDQYDFHGYSMRKFNLNVYLDMIKWGDNLRSQPGYVRAAIAASEIWVHVHDNPKLAAHTQASNKMSDEEKKALKKAKKAAHKEGSKKAHPTAAGNNTNEDKGLEVTPPKDDDADGTKLLQAADGLERAAKFLSPLSTLTKDNIDAWIAIYDVAIRRKKYLQAVQALNRAKALDAEYPQLHVRLVHFRTTVSNLPQQPPNPIGPVLAESASKLLPDEVALATFNSQYLQKHSTSAKAVFASAQVLKLLGHPTEEIESTVFALLNPDVDLDIKTALEALLLLTEVQSKRADEFRLSCDKKFELATVFKDAEEVALLKKNAFAPPPEPPEVNGTDDVETPSS